MRIIPRSQPSGFSLIEMMTVIVIVLVLVGLTIAAIPGINARMARSNITAFKALLESGLESYQKDNGMYPLNEPTGNGPTDRDSAGQLGSLVLYTHLSGDLNCNGQLYDGSGNRDPGDQDAPIYLTELEFRAGQNENARVIRVTNTDFRVVDAYREPFRYLAEKPNKKNKLTVNTTYDLWSLGGSTDQQVASERAQAKYITNWGGN